MDSKLRVKVADFGTSRVVSKMRHLSDAIAAKEAAQRGLHSPSSLEPRDRTLSKGVGSLLWVAPEALRGERITESSAPALDVYRCAL